MAEKTAFTFTDELPKVARGRTYTRTAADDGLDALAKQAAGKVLTVTASPLVRRQYLNAARARGRKVTTRIVEGTLYVSFVAEIKAPK